MEIAVDVGSVEVGVGQAAGNIATANRGKTERGISKGVVVDAVGILHLASRKEGGRDIELLGDIVPVEKVGAMGPDVIHFQRGVSGQLTLDRKCPRLDVWVERILGLDD